MFKYDEGIVYTKGYAFLFYRIVITMKIGIIDADLIGRPLKSAGFPNLACMKIAGYHKDNGDDVTLITDWDVDRTKFDKVYVSKVFSYSQHPDDILSESNVIIGGTGFFFDKSPKLPDEIEHHMPDYHLYDDWIEMRVAARRAERERANRLMKRQNADGIMNILIIQSVSRQEDAFADVLGV